MTGTQVTRTVHRHAQLRLSGPASTLGSTGADDEELGTLGAGGEMHKAQGPNGNQEKHDEFPPPTQPRGLGLVVGGWDILVRRDHLSGF